MNRETQRVMLLAAIPIVLFALYNFTLYGFRSILILHLLYEQKLDEEQAIVIYGMFSMLKYPAFITGAVIGCFIRPILPMLAGLILALVGFLCALLSPGLFAPTGVYFTAVGFGLFYPNLYALYARNLRNIGPSEAFLGWLFFCLLLNAAAFSGPMVLGHLGDRGAFSLGFLICFGAVAGMTGLVIATRKQMDVSQDPATTPFNWQHAFIGLGILFFLWNYINLDAIMVMTAREASQAPPWFLWLEEYSGAPLHIPIFLINAAVFYMVREALTKPGAVWVTTGTGLLFLALSAGFRWLDPSLQDPSQFKPIISLIPMICNLFSEQLVSTACFLLIMRATPPRFLPLSFAAYLCSLYIMNLLSQNANYPPGAFHLYLLFPTFIAAAGCIFFGLRRLKGMDPS